MCRYAMTTYKPHFACFRCRKSFRRRLLSDIQGGLGKSDTEKPAKCPDCGNLMADMGLDFKSPKKTNLKAWTHLEKLYEVGITFHSCGCSGPGYIPGSTKELILHFERIKSTYVKHKSFWARRREDPNTQREIGRDQFTNGRYIYSIPAELRSGTNRKPTYDAAEALRYWGKRIKEVEDNISKLTWE